ncbi:DUF4135 domain-containing protein [Nocardioides zeae]|uniref:DUF4135 domain-containing protein n=1 Tax=Nocardioides imazamoxiresistens TaxID=3231893 RepID=A0ABU3PV76_9ACTN|nr:DUF4135 domain-containing protein [Nocardioides zeae]MDT9593140.1 DUF4135 domain-containing protein [Nocardioides zeae]
MGGALATIFPELDAPELARLLDWVDTLTEGVGADGEPFDVHAPAGDHADAARGTIFGDVVAPLVADVLDRTDADLRALPLGAPDRVSARIRTHAVRQATTLGARFLLRRLDAERREGRLRGTTPEERFADFVDHAASPQGRAALADDLPDLVAWLRHVTRLRTTALVEALGATTREWDALTRTLPGLDARDRVVDLSPGAGDTHGGGAAVAILELASGARVVTKPRSLAVEQGFARFTGWFGERTGVPLPAPASWTSGRRGWVEFVASDRSRSHPDYLRTAGTLLAALHLLRATDMHYENLVPDPSGLPVVIDAESLFTPALVGTDRPAEGLLGVVATGMLSLRREVAEGVEGAEGTADLLDPGALGYRAGGRSPYSSWRAVNPGRDDMRLEMTPVRVEAESPVPAGVERDLRAAEALASAYEQAVDGVLADREAVAAAIERCFESGEVRYIHRPTMSYAQVLRMATHPAFATHRDRHRALARLAVLAPRTPPALLDSEVLQLTDGDLPSFSVPLRGTTVLDGRGGTTGARAVAAPLEQCVRAVRGLSVEDVEREAEQVRGSLSAW